MSVRLTEGSLEEKHVTLLAKDPLRLECRHCGLVWSPNIQPGARLPNAWWKCATCHGL